MSAPLFSIITVTFNCVDDLAATLESVITQPAELCNLWIVDGASNDGTRELAAAFAANHPKRVQLLSEPDRGIYDAMNKGVRHSDGRYLLFLNAGDRLRPGVLAELAATVESECDLLYGNIYHEGRKQICCDAFDPLRLTFRNPPHQATLYRREVFDTIGPYELGYSTSADYAHNIKCFGDPRIRPCYTESVIADFDAGGVSSHLEVRVFFDAKPTLIADHLGQTAYDFYLTSGARFFDILRYLKSERIALIGTPRHAEAAERIRRAYNRKYSADNRIDHLGDLDQSLSEGVIDAHAPRHQWFALPSDDFTIARRRLIDHGVESERIVAFSPAIYSRPFQQLLGTPPPTPLSIYGAGSAGREVHRLIRKRARAIEVKQFFDANEALWGSRIDGVPIHPPTRDRLREDETIIIASDWEVEIRAKLRALGASPKQLLSATY